MSQKLHLGSFKWVEGTSQFNEDYIKSYVDDSNIECFLEVNVQYTESLHNHNHDLPCLFAKVEKKKKINKMKNKNKKKEKLKNEYVIHKTSIKLWVIKFNQESWLK